MENKINSCGRTRALLTEHCYRYPLLQAEDVFKLIFQSAFGCEHLVSDREAALAYIEREYAESDVCGEPLTERLEGGYSRVHLSCLGAGLSAETLTRLFCLSAKSEEKGAENAEKMLGVACELISSGELPLDKAEFEAKAEKWRAEGFPAVRHSAFFRETYRPAYRVVSSVYAEYIRIFTEIDKSLKNKGTVTVAIEGGSASGKSTLAEALRAVYGCNVFHMDDFFLRPEQRTAERFKEIGGNVDYERFATEVLAPLGRGETVVYRPFDCSIQTLSEHVTAAPCRLNVVEGVYSLHPSFGDYCDLSFFLDVSPECQRSRILKRNSPRFAARFFDEWIPLENIYFSQTDIRRRVGEVIAID